MMRSSLLVFLVFAAGCAHQTAPGSTPSTLPAQPRVLASESTEQGRIAEQIVRHFARLPGSPLESVGLQDTGGLSLEVQLRGASRHHVALPLQPHVFAPQTWAPIAREFCAAASAASSGTAPEISTSLLDAELVTIERANRTVSEKLSAAPFDAALHEQAALVLGSMMLLEEAGSFTDFREQVARMTAHLACAAALRHEAAPSLDGEIAQTLIAIAVGRQVEALAATERWKDRAPSWASALRAFVIEDPRAVPAERPSTGLEVYAHARAVRFKTGTRAMAAMLRRWNVPWNTGIYRLVVGGLNASVQDGNQAMRAHSEATAVHELWPIWHPGQPPVSASDVASWPEQDAEFRVISSSDWRDSFMRHALACYEDLDVQMRSRLGLRRESEEMEKALDEKLGGLPLWPVVRAARSHDAAYGDVATPVDCASFVATMQKLTFRAPAVLWEKGAGCPGAVANYQRIAGFPAGTAFDADHRRPFPLSGGLTMTIDLAQARALRELAPYSRGAGALLWQAQRQATVDGARSAFAPLDQYDLDVIALMIQVARPDEKAALLDLECERNVDRCRARVARKVAFEEPDAARLMERMLEEGEDRVQMINAVYPLIDVYFDRGDLIHARELAALGEQIGSSIGFSMGGQLMEREGDYDAAERIYRAADKRYPQDPGYLGAFYVRTAKRTRGKHFSREGKEAEQRIFGGPMAKAAGLSASEPGMEVTSAGRTAKMERFGFQVGDVVVALDGWRVKNDVQFDTVRGLTDAPEMRATVVRAGKLVELNGRYVRRKYGGRPL